MSDPAVTFAEFQASLRSELRAVLDSHESTSVVAKVLERYIRDPGFILGCIERVLLSMQNGRVHWRNPPFDESLEAGYVSRLIFWPANYKSDIHRHNLWTVTGVLYNQIDVVLYDDAGNKQLSRFHGTLGKIGKVNPPCVHAAENNSSVPSITIAIFCRQLRKDRIGPEVEWLTEIRGEAYSRGAFDRALRGFVFLINENRHFKSLDTLDLIYDIAKPGLKLLAIKAMAQIDVERAAVRLDDLQYHLETDADRAALGAVRNALHVAIREG